jgi:hypothetical protein
MTVWNVWTFYYTFSTPVLYSSLYFARCLNLFITFCFVSLSSFALKLYTYFQIIPFASNFLYFCKLCPYRTYLRNNVFIHILIPESCILFTSNFCSILASPNFSISSDTLLCIVTQFCFCLDCYMWTDGRDKENICSSATSYSRCTKHLMKNIITLKHQSKSNPVTGHESSKGNWRSG